MSIRPPNPGKVPLKTNAYAHGRAAHAMLSPLFPYSAPGAIVPCIAMIGTGSDYMGYFVHHNTVQEVFLCVGTRGPSYVQPGMCRVGTKLPAGFAK